MFDSNNNFNPNPDFDRVTGVLNLMRAIPGGKGVAALYWEPEADRSWGGGWPESAFANHEPTSALDSMRPSIMHTSGTNIIDGSGQPIQLKGVNLGGYLLMEPWMTPADSSGLADEYSIIQKLDSRFGVSTEQSLIKTYRQSWINSQDFDKIKAQGLNVVRVPVWWGDFYPLSALGSATAPVLRSDAFDQLDWLLQQASERGIYTVIDMHGVFGGQSTSDDTGQANANQYWTSASDQANTQAMWSAIAAHYRGNAWVAGYDLLNEPDGAPSQQAALTQINNLYTAVRAADPDHMIFVEGTFGHAYKAQWGWGALPSPSSQGWTNVVYEMHEYQYNTTDANVQKGADNQVADFINHQASDNVPCYIGEFNDFGYGDAWTHSVGAFNANGMSWSSWSYKATHGPAPDSWGLYDPNGKFTTVPNIANDPSSTISSDWSKWTTANTFSINPLVSGILVGGSNSITSLPQTTAGAGNPFTFQITATGTPTSFGATNLPAGLTLNSATGLISGTPADPGDSNHTTVQTIIAGLTVNYAGTSCTGGLLFTIYPPGPTIVSNLKQSATVGKSVTLYVSTATELGGLKEISSPGTELPPGLSITAPGNGLISGTPATAGTFTAELSACNQWGVYGPPVMMTFTVNANPSAPVFTSPTTASGVVGSAFSYAIKASNNPTSYGATGLPAGLSVNTSTGVISGTPTAAAKSSVTLSATNASGTVTQTLVLTITASAPTPTPTPTPTPAPTPVSKPVISSAASASGTVGKAFSYQITASNAPTGFSATGLPAGLSVSAASGLISGTPTAAGTAGVGLGASNAGGTGTASLSLVVNPPVPVAPTGLTGFGWDKQVDLRWSASANATGYNVLRATAANGTYTTVASHVATAYYSDTAGLADAATYFYEVTAAGVSGPSAASAPLSVTTVRSGDNAWSAGDVGAVGTAGSASYQNGTYTLTGSGSDIYGGADAFQFMSQPLVGDGSIEARVVSVSDASVWSKAGVMIRASLAANAANMAIVVTPTPREGVSSQWRTAAGDGTGYVQTTGVSAPSWVKLVRAGNVLTSYYSADGVSWTRQSTQTIPMAGPVYAGLAVTAHDDGAVCTASFDSVNVLPADPAWLADDLGAPAIAGFSAYSGGVLTLNGAGSDIWSTGDQFRYVYQPAAGDCTVTARMTGVENSNLNAKAGVMIRESLAANSAQVDVLATANVGVYVQSRTSTGAGTGNVAINGALPLPCWLRLARVGSTFTASTSLDGSTWTPLGTTTVTMGANVYVGVAATSHDATKLGTATADNLSVSP